MLERASNTQRKLKRSLLFWGALCLGMLCLFFIVVSAYFLVIKPSYLDKTSQSSVSHHVASWYGSQEHLLKNPSDVAFDRAGHLYVADAGARSIVVFDRYGQRVDAFGTHALRTPVSVALASDGRVYVVDASRKELLIFDKSHALIKSVSFEGASPLSVSVGAAQASDLGGDEALYVSFGTGLAKGTLEGVFERAYFNGGAQNDQMSGVCDVATSQGANQKGLATPQLYLVDALAKRTIALGSFDASPTVDWLSTRALLPSGVAADESHVYVTDALGDCVRVLDAQTGALQSKLGRQGTGDGELLQPRGIALHGQQIYVADSANGRIAIYNIPGAPGAKIQTHSRFETVALLALCVLFGCASLTCWIVRSLIKPQRYIVDFSVADTLSTPATRQPLERVAERLYFTPELAEWMQRGLAASSLRAKPAHMSEKNLARIEQEFPAFDSFDKRTLACALTLGCCVVTVDDAVRTAAEALGLEVTSPSVLRATTEQTDDEEGSAAPHALLFVLFVAGCILAGAASFASSQAQAAGVEHSVVVLSMLSKPTHQKKENVSYVLPAKSFNHVAWQSDCAACHESSLDENAVIVDTKTTCEFCHTGSALGNGAMAYEVNGGNAADLGEKNSGHQVGLHDGVPASNNVSQTELTCLSCHSTHAADKKTAVARCESCHNEARASKGAVAAYKENKANERVASDHFTLTKSVKAHDVLANGTNGNAAHTAAQLSCANCHRANLSSRGTCTTCHYDERSFDKDVARARRASDWPHLSTNDTALLGAWTTKSSGAELGKRVSIPGGMTLENQTRTACGRCHTTQDGETFASSMHTVKHDAVRSKMVEYLTSKATTSTLRAVSPGYIGTGGNANAAPFASSFDFGPEDGSFEGVPCETCHYSDVQTEHQLRSAKSCNACHTTRSHGKTDWNVVKGNVSAQAFTSCGTKESACHKGSWHGSDPAKTLKAHALSGTNGKALKKTSCAPDGKGLSCHGATSAQSLFRFGAQDLASAHNDYWIAQKQNYSTNARYTETISNIDSLRGCGLCHDKKTSVINGVKQRAAAKASGHAFECSSCHSQQTAVYAENECLKAPVWKAPTLTALRAKAQDDALTKEANDYLTKLAQQGSSPDIKNADDQTVTSKLKASTADATLRAVPTEILPVSHPLAPVSPFSVIRAYLAPYPSLLNRPTTSWQNL